MLTLLFLKYSVLLPIVQNDNLKQVNPSYLEDIRSNHISHWAAYTDPTMDDPLPKSKFKCCLTQVIHYC